MLASLDDRFYILDERINERYVDIPIDTDFPTTYKAMGATLNNLPPHFAIRGAQTLAELLTAFSWGMLVNERIASYDMVDTEDGGKVHEIVIAGDTADMIVRVDPSSRLVKTMVLRGTVQGMPEDFHLIETITFATEVRAALPQPITVDPGDRKPVLTAEVLVRGEQPDPPPAEPEVKVVEKPKPKSDLPPAPDFTLGTLDGETVSLADLRGSVVVLDFWATWCGWCKKGLPLLQEFATWAAGTEHPVKVYAIDTLERGGTPEEIEKKVRKYWEAAGFKMQTLMDRDNAVAKAFGASGLPRTVVVGPDGGIISVHKGFNPNMVRMLRADVAEALDVVVD
jgi:thiol-disulfide isomerase/thioredoxin